MDSERAAAKRRASFGRAGRLAKEAQQRQERETVEAQRRAERQKADEQRKADAVKAAEQRTALARKQAEQRRLHRHKENLRQEFNRKAEDRKATTARAQRQQADQAAKEAGRRLQAEQDQKRREAEAHVERQHQRQEAEQQSEHRRQTHRLRVEHQAERSGFRHKEAGALTLHARQIRNVDIAERRELEALDERRQSLSGRMVGLVRGSKHYDRQVQAITDRHENTRWQKHREHEANKDALFGKEQMARLRQVSDRRDMAQRHHVERHELIQSQEKSRPQLIEARAQALTHANENQKARQKQQSSELVRPSDAFNKAAEQSAERTR